MDFVKRSGILGSDVEQTVNAFNQEKLQSKLQSVIDQKLPRKRQGDKAQIEFKSGQTI